MRILVLLMVCLISLSANGQKSLNKLFKNYKNVDHVMAFDLTGNMLNFLIKDETHQNNIDNVRILIFQDGNGLSEKEKSTLIKDLINSDLDELATMRSSDSNIDFYVKDEGMYIQKLVMYVDSDDNEILAELNGNIHYDKLKDLDINIDGMENLSKIGKSKKKQ